MFICTFYHTPVAFCDRGIVFYITKGVSLMRHPLFFFRKISGLHGFALHFFCHMVQLIEIVSLYAHFFHAVCRAGGCFFSLFAHLCGK